MSGGVYIQNNRRNYHYVCKYYKKLNINDSSLKHKDIPDGYFYAKEIKDKENDSDNLVGSFQVSYETIHIETPDDVNLSKNDIVNFCNCDWLVDKVEERISNKRGEFCASIVRYKSIILRR